MRVPQGQLRAGGRTHRRGGRDTGDPVDLYRLGVEDTVFIALAVMVAVAAIAAVTQVGPEARCPRASTRSAPPTA